MNRSTKQNENGRKPLKVLIYGAGAVGLGIASCLLKAGQEVLLIAREDTAALLNQNGVIRDGIFGDYFAPPGSFEAAKSLDEMNTEGIDYILVAVKSFDTLSAAQNLYRYKEKFSPGMKLVLLQNGWGNAEVFAEYFKREEIYSARVITGFTRPSKNHVTITVHAEEIRIGSVFHNDDCPELGDLCDSISAGGIECAHVAGVARDILAKLIYNSALNPLGAVLGMTYGDLAANSHTKLIMDTLIREIYAVLKAAGLSTHWASADEYIQVFYEKLVPRTASHKSSTLQSLMKGLKTEIDALNGAVIRLAEKHNVAVPSHRFIVEMVYAIEERNKKGP